MPAHTTQSIAQRVGGTLSGAGDLPVTGLAELRRAGPGDLTLIGSERFAEAWPQSRASAALVAAHLAVEPGHGRALIAVDNPDLAMAAVLEDFLPPPPAAPPGIHPTAVIDPAATLGQGVAIGPHCYVGPGASVGDHCVLHHRVSIMDDAQLGAHSLCHPGVVIGARCVLGHHATLHANAVIGADGFGYRAGDTAAGQSPIIKIPHVGNVVIGDHVEIGAGTCIDRGKFDATTLGSYTKIDNLVQIAHNCHIGNAVLIAGCTGIAGSVTIGDGSMLGGAVSVRDHITIGKGVSLAGSASVMDDVPDGAKWAGEPAKPIKEAAREELAIRQLPELLKQYRKMQRGG